MKPRLESEIGRAVAAAISAGQIPGAVVLVGRRDEVLLHEAYGHRMLRPEPRPMLPDTIFDLASLTKPVATATSVMQLVERGLIRPERPVADWLPEFGGRGVGCPTVSQLLTHASGLPAYRNYLGEWPDMPARQRRRRVLEDLAELPPHHPPGTDFLYSCLNYVVLAALVQRVGGQRLDEWFAAQVARPLGLRDTRFHAPGALDRSPRRRERCAATEGDLCGTVHDEISRFLGGVSGNAGLFSTAADLSRFMRMVLHGGELDGVRVLEQRTVRQMRTPQLRLGRLLRGWGWDIATSYTPAPRGSFPDGSFGHGGFTGTSIWADPQSRVYVIILSNRVHLGRETDVSKLRRRVANVVAKELIG